MAEAHPVAFRWVMKARERGAAVVGVEQGERREVVELDAVEVDEDGLEASVGQERTVGGELGEGHHILPATIHIPTSRARIGRSR